MKLFAIAAMLALLAAGTASSEPLNRQGFVSFQPKAGLVMPTGNYRNVSKVGLGLQGTVEYYFAGRWSVGAAIDFTRSNAKAEAIRAREAALSAPPSNRVAGGEQNVPLPPSFDIQVSPALPEATAPVSISSWKTKTLQVGAFTRYLIPTGSASLNPFVAAGMGFYNVGGSVSGNGATQQVLNQATGADGRTSFGVNFGTGVMFNVTPSAGFMTGITYHNAFSSPATSYFQINTGLNFLFNPGR